MAIEQASALSAITGVKAREQQEYTQQIRDKKVASTETVKESNFSLSNVQKRLLEPQKSDIDVEKVEKLKLAIKNGTLKMDASKIADGLFRDALESSIALKNMDKND